ncbi:M10 family metallopeptidase C-terminal domain-containing protein [Paracoccus sp. 1_MG-2023]|uniref:M10 family metallopeptidase C-terminal domain-containing protein n=1 Tax=unclassified Paracoccus (in: a-proteobacteria) TaxID=2688777 RepID=UPI001C09BFF4|nr:MULTISPECIES: M10 family metallopeptidase C-terminal domain-containing protein [unclassified Paracoccus (in: a-proteobacteria)]MBU2958440.1 M10 family metallopeptidase C-terminal domain-containing protein [Paracoccus sp. C2R09]MDO6668575.1 M10 family metallopeptidase C-terminal domain-containing protein [Paracoccus sp. 1_MG-2023]
MCTICESFRPTDPECPYGGIAAPLRAEWAENGDAAGGSGTTARMDVGDTFTGTIGRSGDHDWIAIDLAAGSTYRIGMEGLSLPDPYLYLRDASGKLVASNDDADGLDSQITYTATRGGRFYIDAAAYSTHTGSYRISLDGVDPGGSGTIEDLARYLTDGFWNDRYEDARAFVQDVISVDLTALTQAGRALARGALEAWAAVADLRFVEKPGNADITFDDADSGAYAYSVVSGGRILSSYINVSTWWLDSYGTQIGSYGFQTYIHEVGHALGLGHQGNYNGSGTFASDAVFAMDSWQASIMSYFPQSENPNIAADYAYVATPMAADVIAIRDIYDTAGSESLTAGATVYGRGHNLGDSWLGQIFDAQMGAGGVADAWGVAMTISDVGGWDRLDLGHDGHDQQIDMRMGGVSDVFGMRGNLQIAAGTLIEALFAGNGDDRIVGNAGRNNIRGGDGDDRIFGNGGNDTLSGNNGNDLLRSMAGNNRMAGGNGQDTLEAGDGRDWLSGGNGNDTIIGGSGADTLLGNGGADRLEGRIGRDLLRGGFGNDLIFAGLGNDSLHGDNGNDRMQGGNGNDLLRGNLGADLLQGGAGADTLDGGYGADILWGGAGSDVFRFSFAGQSPLGGADLIRDFGRGDDVIDLGATGIDGFDQLTIARAGSETRITADMDGDGNVDMVIRLSGIHALQDDSFIF